MSEKLRDMILIGILICLIVIALKPVPQFSVSQPQPYYDQSSGESILQIAPNRIGVVDARGNSGMHGTIYVFDFDQKNKTFKFTGRFNYGDFFSNPQNHQIIP